MDKMTIDEIKNHLNHHNIKPSLPRVKILEYLVDYKSHPTIDEIYAALSKELITLSKTTVYNTLDLFVKNNVAMQVLIEDNETRYDADVSNHGHFKCLMCNRVYDFYYDLSKIEIKSLEGFTSKEYHSYIKGICKNCNEKIM